MLVVLTCLFKLTCSTINFLLQIVLSTRSSARFEIVMKHSKALCLEVSKVLCVEYWILPCERLDRGERVGGREQKVEGRG